MEDMILEEMTFSVDEQFTLMLIKAAEDVGFCPSFQESWQKQYKQAANSLTKRGLLYRCYDPEYSDRPINKDNMDYALKTKEAHEIAEYLYNKYFCYYAEYLYKAAEKRAIKG